VAERFGLPLADKDTWNLRSARRSIRPVSSKKIIDFHYRPFDRQTLYYDRTIVARPNTRILSGLRERDNLALVVGRQGGATGSAIWDVCFVTNTVPDQNIFRRGGGTVFPLWLAADGKLDSHALNLDQRFAAEFAAALGSTYDPKLGASQRGELVPYDILAWIYALLHSLAYRQRYAADLRNEFPRIPLPGSKELFQELVPLGTKLVALHLLDTDAAPELKDPKSVRFAGNGEARVERKPEWSAAGGNRVTISSHRWFEGVPERVWNSHIGGYQPAQKWLKYRAAKGGKKKSSGRVLTAEYQLHYRRMVVAMDKTFDLMAVIDRVIEKHGGWPAAFKGMRDEEQG
jgi:predicted helicase